MARSSMDDKLKNIQRVNMDLDSIIRTHEELTERLKDLDRKRRMLKKKGLKVPPLSRSKRIDELIKDAEMHSDDDKKKAREKIDAAKKRALEKTAKGSQKSVPEKTKHVKEATPKTAFVPTSKKSSFTQRRSGG